MFIKTIQDRKMTQSSTFLIRLRFQGYHWEAGTVILTWRVIKSISHKNFNYDQKGCDNLPLINTWDLCYETNQYFRYILKTNTIIVFILSKA